VLLFLFVRTLSSDSFPTYFHSSGCTPWIRIWCHVTHRSWVPLLTLYTVSSSSALSLCGLYTVYRWNWLDELVECSTSVREASFTNVCNITPFKRRYSQLVKPASWKLKRSWRWLTMLVERSQLRSKLVTNCTARGARSKCCPLPEVKKVMSHQNTVWLVGMIFASTPDWIDDIQATTLVLYYTAKNILCRL